MKKSVVFECRFSSAHLYHQPKWDAAQNREVFGRCFTEHGHGHNYRALVQIAEVTDSELASTRAKLDQIISKVDYEHLNFVIPEFKEKIPTTENICLYLKKEIEKSISHPLLSIELFEDHDIGAQLISDVT